ncbi:MAG: DNA methylase [Cyanobacteria bacterium P01_F01_bin.33]
MAKAPVHKLGQMIGEFIEKYFEDELTQICEQRNLYLDVVGKDRPARKGKKVSWYDVYGNKHDLDFVIERNGSETELGIPVAIIECAWRRYTKHSKNKAQEIQGAVLPIAEKYKYHKPFLGAVIAGVYTEPSISQLNSCGFKTIYFEYESIVAAFSSVGVDVNYDEDTPDHEAVRMVEALEQLSVDSYRQVFQQVVSLSSQEVNTFKSTLEEALDRQIQQIIIAPLYGSNSVFPTIDEAIDYLDNFDTDEIPEDIELMKIYIQIRYSNGDNVSGEFSTNKAATEFLASTVRV